jgi:hypothetical protein
VVTSDGRTYKGNVFDGAFSATGGAADTRNNVESVYLPAGTTGRLAVKVVGANIPGDGVPGNANATDQDYALVVSNAEPSPAAIVVHDAVTLDASVGAGGDGDGVVEPGEPFALDERLANVGDATASGVSGTVAVPAATMRETTSVWPDIASGTSATNATRFTGTLASDATCGANVPATLSLTTAAGTETVSLTLTTRGPGTPVADCTIAAVTKLTSGPDEGSAGTNRSPSFEFGSDLPNATYQCRLNTETFRACTSPKKYAGLPDGTYAFEVRATVAGATDPTPARRTWTIDTTAPDSAITDGPSGRVSSTAASLRFAATDGTFECSLDGAAFAACTSPQDYDALAEGAHTFAVRARDAVGNLETSPATRDWTIDTTAPAPAITTPVDGKTIGGSAGTAPGDADTVTATVLDEVGTPVRTLTTTRDAAGAWSAAVQPALPAGRYTVRATQADAAAPANVGQSTDVAFEIAPTPIVIKHPMPPPPPTPRPAPPVAPSFVVAPAEARPGDALLVVAACASACTATADLAGHGSASASLAAAGTAVLRVRVKRRQGRPALRVTVAEGARTLTLERPVSIRRAAGLRRIAVKGLRLSAACTGGCPLRATLTVSGRPVAAAQSPSALTLRASGKAKAKLRKARRLRALLDVVTVTDPSRAAQLKMPLRR